MKLKKPSQSSNTRSIKNKLVSYLKWCTTKKELLLQPQKLSFFCCIPGIKNSTYLHIHNLYKHTSGIHKKLHAVVNALSNSKGSIMAQINTLSNVKRSIMAQIFYEYLSISKNWQSFLILTWHPETNLLSSRMQLRSRFILSIIKLKKIEVLSRSSCFPEAKINSILGFISWNWNIISQSLDNLPTNPLSAVYTRRKYFALNFCKKIKNNMNPRKEN